MFLNAFLLVGSPWEKQKLAFRIGGVAKIGGWGGESNREIVSCRACVRAVRLPSRFGAKKSVTLLSLFPLFAGEFSLFSLVGLRSR